MNWYSLSGLQQYLPAMMRLDRALAATNFDTRHPMDRWEVFHHLFKPIQTYSTNSSHSTTRH